MSKILVPLFCVLAGTGLAQGIQDYDVSGEWAIKMNTKNGNGCFMQRSFESGTVVQIGFGSDEEGAFFATYSADWADMGTGETSQLLFDFGDSRFQGAIVGTVLDDVPGGYAFFNNPAFAAEFAKRTSVTLQRENGRTEMIDLTGSKRAIDAVKQCQEKG